MYRYRDVCPALEVRCMADGYGRIASDASLRVWCAECAVSMSYLAFDHLLNLVYWLRERLQAIEVIVLVLPEFVDEP
jgi:hypothetical protein